MKTALFDYQLLKELIAQRLVRPRDHSRLMILDRRRKTIKHARFFEIGKFLRPGDLLVVNDTKVFKARLFGKLRGNKKIELLLLRPTPSHSPSQWEGEKYKPFSPPSLKGEEEGVEWLCLGKPGKYLLPGSLIIFGKVRARVLEKGDRGEIAVRFTGVRDVMRWANRVGHVPVPPYVAWEPKRFADYQTVYAKKTGSVAAPTAGFHFTPRLIRELKKKGMRLAKVTLHVGLGTFRPIQSDEIEAHTMHEEYAEIPRETVQAIQETKARGGRVIAVGTTTVRALEGLLGSTELQTKKLQAKKLQANFVNLYIHPGYHFKIIDGLITNFHLPKSTLLVLVSTFAGRTFILRAYKEAIRQKYRFYSFGDAMLIQ